MNAVNDFAQIVRRNIGCHTNSNTNRTVYQNIRETGGEDCRLLQTIVIVGNEGNGFLVDIREHFQCNLRHPRFCITISSRRIAVHGTKVTLAVYQDIPHGKGLRQTYQRVINRCVTMGVIATQYRAYRVGTLMVRLVRCQSLFKHGVKNTAVNRL